MPFNFPAPLPAKRFSDGLSYPLNLKADNRGYFTRIEFIKYQPAYGADALKAVGGELTSTVGGVVGAAIGGVVGSFGGLLSAYTGAVVGSLAVSSVAGPFGEILANQGTVIGSAIHLPIPKKINEMNMMNWSEISLTNTILSAARATAGTTPPVSLLSSGLQIGSAFAGIQINPFILQYFQRPSFREFSFTWTLAPRNKKESEQINLIIRQIKAAQAPRRAAGGFIMEYPDLAVVKFNPQDEFQVELKECVIVGVNVDYTPAGGPSYINGTAAPTMVNLTIHLKETLLWWSEEWGGSAGTAESPQGRPAEDNTPNAPGNDNPGVNIPIDENGLPGYVPGA